jgi:hypothetical protein
MLLVAKSGIGSVLSRRTSFAFARVIGTSGGKSPSALAGVGGIGDRVIAGIGGIGDRVLAGVGGVETEPLVEHAANNRNARLAHTDTIRDFLIRPPALSGLAKIFGHPA